jgi:hypothetical protein
VSAGFEGVYQARDGALSDFAEEGLELGIGFLDGVHVGTVGGQISQLGAGGPDELLDPRPLVARQIVDHDDVAGREVGDETFVYPFLERGRVHRPVEGLLRDETGKAKAGDERDRLVMAVGNGGAQASTAPASSVLARQIRGRSGLVDENKFPRIEVELRGEPVPTPL